MNPLDEHDHHNHDHTQIGSLVEDLMHKLAVIEQSLSERVIDVIDKNNKDIIDLNEKSVI